MGASNEAPIFFCRALTLSSTVLYLLHSMLLKFYVYKVSVDGLVRYIGKGSDDSGGYSRLKDYTGRMTRVTAPVRERLLTAIAAGSTVRAEILEEFPLPVSTARPDVIAAESVVMAGEARWAALFPEDQLWNSTTCGKSGYTVSDEGRERMAFSQTTRETQAMSSSHRAAIADAHRGKTLDETHRAAISAGLKAAWGTSRPRVTYSCSAEQLASVPPIGGLSHNAVLPTRAVAEEFLLAHSGSTRDELKAAFFNKFGRTISNSAVYALLARYGLKFAGLRTIDSDDPKEQRAVTAARVASRTRAERHAELGISGELEPQVEVSLGELGNNRVVYLVTGVSGSGKSWVCEQLSGVCYVRYDDHASASRLSALAAATHQPLPIVYDPLRAVTTLINKNKGRLFFRLGVIVEPESVILGRLAARGGSADLVALRQRMQRNDAYKRLYADFHGSSTEVLQKLTSVISADDCQKLTDSLVLAAGPVPDEPAAVSQSLIDQRAPDRSTEKMGRPKGWTLTFDELEHLGLAAYDLPDFRAGLIPLTDDQKRRVRNYRHKRGREQMFADMKSMTSGSS